MPERYAETSCPNRHITASARLDAIHLASALSIRADLSAFLAYDHRLVAAAAGAGLESISPGRPLT